MPTPSPPPIRPGRAASGPTMPATIMTSARTSISTPEMNTRGIYTPVSILTLLSVHQTGRQQGSPDQRRASNGHVQGHEGLDQDRQADAEGTGRQLQNDEGR